MRWAFRFSLLLLVLALASIANGETPSAIEFNRDVRPILADHCFACHGPDARQRKADLRLDTPEAANPKRENGPIVVAGRPEKSELWRRVNSSDPEERMPPPDKGRGLNDGELSILRQWIIQGAEFEKHWSLLPVRQPALPEVKLQHAANVPLDTFIVARLEREGLGPSPEADRATLLRRVTLGLTGLPPTPDEVDAFLNDKMPDAYERVVDRLLASPRYGERMAVPWLDAARYADTSGYQSDGERFMWRWRDWVIEALNANMPFDQFTIEQLAGDLLPNPTLDQRIATGFNRNHRGNSEGGIIPEEYAVEYVADRVETTTTVWLGLTLGCARCHDHKYDPFTQRDFYSLFAFFNNVPEKGRAIKLGNSPPYIQAPTRLQAEELRGLLQKHGFGMRSSVGFGIALSEWQAKREAHLGDWNPTEDQVTYLPLDGDLKEQLKSNTGKDVQGNLKFVIGRLGSAAAFDGQTVMELGNAGNFGFFDKFTLAAWIKLEKNGGGTIVSRMDDVDQGEGYQLAVVAGKLQFNLVKRWLDDALRVESSDAISPGEWHHVAVTYDGSRVAEGVKLFVDGQEQSQSVLLDELNQSFATKQPLRIGGGGGPKARFRGLIDELRIYGRALEVPELATLATSHSLDEILALDREKLLAGQAAKLELSFWNKYGPAEARTAYAKYVNGLREFAEYREKLPTVMVMEEMPEPRQTHLLIRGQYDKPGERVEPATPGQLPPMAKNAPLSRLGLARWLVARANPLTSRVFVNRIWQLHFSTGIVKTSEDFGLQGEWPSHPELLDWLASEFALDWDVKRLQRIIVTSGTYRQSSSAERGMGSAGRAITAPRSELRAPTLVDPDNRLLWHGPRLRLSGEMIRDQALFASGMLVEQLGGPSVKPLQPAGLWSELTGGDDYQAGSGAELVRRSLYTFWKRTIPPPTLSTFDSPSREACVVRESRTNTPLQALTLMNEPTFVAAAKALAERAMGEANSPRERIERAMLYAIGRRPTIEEMAVLTAALDRYRKLRSKADEVAAYALVCSTILNLDEAVTSQ